MKSRYDMVKALTGVGLGVLLLAFPLALSGQDLCGEVLLDCISEWESSHNFIERLPESEEAPSGGYHGECLLCVSGGQEQPVELCHPICGEPEEQEQLQLALGQLDAAFLDGDSSRLTAVARTISHRVVINLDRGALQVQGCADQVVASYPVGTSIRRLAARIFEAETTEDRAYGNRGTDAPEADPTER